MFFFTEITQFMKSFIHDTKSDLFVVEMCESAFSRNGAVNLAKGSNQIVLIASL